MYKKKEKKKDKYLHRNFNIQRTKTKFSFKKKLIWIYPIFSDKYFKIWEKENFDKFNIFRGCITLTSAELTQLW